MKNCNECEYFVQHYIKKGIYFVKTSGHCISPQRKRYALKESCEYFTQSNKRICEEKIAEEKSIEFCLEEINRRLEFLNTYFVNK